MQEVGGVPPGELSVRNSPYFSPSLFSQKGEIARGIERVSQKRIHRPKLAVEFAAAKQGQFADGQARRETVQNRESKSILAVSASEKAKDSLAL